MMAITSHSYITNDDGEGVYTNSDDRVIKSLSKIDYSKVQGLKDSKVIISHQRFSTSGFTLKYNHPFHNDNFVLVHNGVINHFKEENNIINYIDINNN